MKVYLKASNSREEKGIIICDTKFEWGVTADNKTILIDEALTPDSSRFWPLEDYKPGRPQHSYDKQFISDYPRHPLERNRPQRFDPKTSEKYQERIQALTGKGLF